jgi:hypothetical protein
MKKLFTRKTLVAILLLFGASAAKAQGTLYQLSPPAPNAQVLVCPSPDNGYPCPAPVAIYSNVTLTTVVPQPVSLGASGFFSFYIASGTYTIQLLGPGYNSGNRQVVNIGGGSGSGITQVSSLTLPCTNNTIVSLTGATNQQGIYICLNGQWVPDAQGAGVVYASSFGVLSNQQTVFNATLNGTTTVTSTSNPWCNAGSVPCAPGQQTSVGKKFTAATGGTGTAKSTSITLCAETTISVVNSAGNITLAVACGNSASNTTASWYTNDDTGWTALETYIATLPSCPSIVVSGPGLSAIATAHFVKGTSECNPFGPSGPGSDSGLAIGGSNPKNSGFFIQPSFNYSSCTGTNHAMFGDLPGLYLHDLMFYGGEVSNPSTGTCTELMVEAIDTKILNVEAVGLGGNAPGFSCLLGLGGGQATGYLIFDACGSPSVQTGALGGTDIIYSFIGDMNGAAVNISAGNFEGLFNGYGPSNSATALMTVTAGHEYRGVGDFFTNGTPTGAVGLNVAGIAFIDNANFVSSDNSSDGITIASGGIAHVTHTTFNLSGTSANAWQAQTGGQMDESSNRYIAGAQFATDFGSWIAPGHSLTASCTGVASASSTLGLYGTGPNLTTLTCTSATIGAGFVMPSNVSAHGLMLSSSATTVSVAGTLLLNHNGGGLTTTALTCTMTAATICRDTTHGVAVVAGDLISVQIVTGLAETGANIKASIVW